MDLSIKNLEIKPQVTHKDRFRIQRSIAVHRRSMSNVKNMRSFDLVGRHLDAFRDEMKTFITPTAEEKSYVRNSSFEKIFRTSMEQIDNALMVASKLKSVKADPELEASLAEKIAKHIDKEMQRLSTAISRLR